MKKLRKKRQTVCIIGLGYVGFPLALRSKERGYIVYGIDHDRKKISTISKGKSPIAEKQLQERARQFPITATTDRKVLKRADIVCICVPTPVDKQYYPDLGPVINASKLVASNCKRGALVILESTVNPGVSEEIVRPIFEKAGYTVGKDIFIAHCPERINPGDPQWNVTNIPRVVGSFDKKGLRMAIAFYKSIVDGEVRPMKSIREAEAVKIVENSFRDINIAFVNELARSFDRLQIDVKEVIEGAATKPFSFMPHYPSCGVGGHCIPVDPYYLIEHAKRRGFDHKLLRTSRAINNAMPEYTVELLQDALNALKLPVNGTPVGVLGIAYKADVDDDRESPFYTIIQHLKKHNAEIYSFDPLLPQKSSCKSLEELLKKSKAIVLVTNHSAFLSIDPKTFKKNGIAVIIDGKNCLNKQKIEDLGILYKGIGR